MKYFFDNNISFRLAEMLHALQVDAVALRHEFAQDVDDVSLFTQLQGRNLVYVTSDISQRTREHEARALKEAQVTSIFLAPFFNKLDLWRQAAWLVAKWPKIDAFCVGVARGTQAEIKQNGAALVYPG